METIDLTDSRPIAGFPDCVVTRDGAIYSRRLTGNWRKRKPATGRDGYMRVKLCNDTEQRTCYVHRLVAVAWVGNPDDKPEVNHVNHIKADNRADNLEWVTHAENLAKAHVHHGNWSAHSSHAAIPVIATPANGGAQVEWASARAWAINAGNVNRAANVCKAIQSGRAAYGFIWSRKEIA